MQPNHLYDIMNTNIVGVSPSTSVSDTVRIMRRNGISSLLIWEEKKPVGIFTERDIVKSVASGKPQFNEEIRGMMTSPVITIKGDMDLYDVHQYFILNDIRHLVVVDDNHVAVGMVTPTDLMPHMSDEYVREKIVASRIMKNVMFTIPEKSTIFQALTDMARKSLDCIVVSNNHKPIGIVTERDAASLLLKRTHILKQPVKTIMSSPVQTVNLNATPHEVIAVMKKNHVRRVVVVDKEGAIVGLVNQADLIKGLENQHVELLKKIIANQIVEIDRLKKQLSDTRSRVKA